MHNLIQHQLPWLAKIDKIALISALLELSDRTGIYLVDNQQTVIYWSRSLADLTGLAISVMEGAACPPELAVNRQNGQQQKTIRLQTDTQPLTLINTTRVLTDNDGQVFGVIGMLIRPEQLANAPEKPKPIESKQNFHGILSRSPAMQNVFQIIQNAAETEATVLVRGESGAGKELVAKAIHQLSSRQKAPFLAVNCAALSSNLLESELFGHVRGAFTGAIKDHEGLFKRANGGTLFLDEVAELPLELQAKLLRVLQERNYLPVGGNQSIDVDVRIVAATHRSLREEVRRGTFREDLMYRLRVVPIFLPPLRERREDISLLIWHFIGQHNNPDVRVIGKIDPVAMRLLLDYAWPGNVRELHNVVEYAFAVGRGSTLRLTDLPPEFREPKAAAPAYTAYKTVPRLTAEDEETAIKEALSQTRGRAGEAANLLGISRATFWRKRKQYGI